MTAPLEPNNEIEIICLTCLSGGHPASDKKKYGKKHHYETPPKKAPPEPNNLDELFDEYFPVGTVKPNKKVDADKAELMTKIIKSRRDDFKAATAQLLVRARIDALESLPIKAGTKRHAAPKSEIDSRLKALKEELSEDGDG